VHVRVGADDDAAWIEVTDEGPGMEPEAADHVFDRFFRADRARSRRGGNSGLGLAIVAGIAEAHGGAAAVASDPGSGTTFVIRLPRTPSGAGVTD
jgi:signal transduction histidine kinase